jgi:hypothetical protein
MDERGSRGFGSVVESNWMITWRQICKIYVMMKENEY